jgi:NAD(P)-dependent dehydrogenase (short-subunit alcohol dehydrogenase family)
VSGGSDLGAETCEVARRSANASGGGLARAAVTVDGGNMAGKSEEAAVAAMRRNHEHQTHPGRAAGKVVVVTGASQGQGAAEARALEREGATVIGVDVRDPLEVVEGVQYGHLDVSSDDDWTALRDWLQREYGVVHGLVDNAGVTQRERFGVRVNTILPGVIVTPMADDATEAWTRKVVGEIPMGRRGTAEDVAPLVVFLISDESSCISGAEITVDGGQAAHGGMNSLADAVRDAAGDR